MSILEKPAAVQIRCRNFPEDGSLREFVPDEIAINRCMEDDFCTNGIAAKTLIDHLRRN